MGSRIGRKTRKIETPSISMPAMSRIAVIASSITVSFAVKAIRLFAAASKAPTVDPAWAKTEASAMMIITTAEISAESASTL